MEMFWFLIVVVFTWLCIFVKTHETTFERVSFIVYNCISIKLTLRRRKGTSLVAQWLRIHLPMPGTRVRALVPEDPACCGTTKPVHHNYWTRVPQLLKPVPLEPVLHNKRSHCNEKPAHLQRRVASTRCN